MESQQPLRVKLLDPNAKAPRRMSDKAAGYDLFALEGVTIPPFDRAIVSTGVAIAVPDGFEGQVRPRSGLAFKYGLMVVNSPGTIDSDYRGEVKVCLHNTTNKAYDISNHERIAQLVIAPVHITGVEIVEALEGTVRGDGGFGSTGKR